MSTVDLVNKEVMDLWEQWYGLIIKNGGRKLIPLIYPEMRQNVILFLGMNPSFDPQSYRRILRHTPYSDVDPEIYFQWENRDELSIEKCQNIEKQMRENYRFFSKFKEIGMEMDLGYEHIDLFFNRETEQKVFEKRFLYNPEMADFIDSQIALSIRLIKYVHPKLIVVANAGASKLFDEHTTKGYVLGKLGKEINLKWDDKLGYYSGTVYSKPIPVFLTSMLTQQRALDNGSYRRLKWHIKQALLS